MNYLPIFFNAKQKSVVVIGGGDVALRKIALLLKAGAEVTVFAQQFHPQLKEWASQGKVNLNTQVVELDSELWQQEVALVYLATDDEALNHGLSKRAQLDGKLVNVVDNPALCSFITPSILDRGDLVVAISTSGVAPVLAKMIRAKLEAWLPLSTSQVLQFVKGQREKVQQAYPLKAQKGIWERFFTALKPNQDLDKQLARACDSIDKFELHIIMQDSDAHFLPLSSLAMLSRVDLVLTSAPLSEALDELRRRDADVEPFSMARLQQAKQAEQTVLLVIDDAHLDIVSAEYSAIRWQSGAAIQA